MEKVLNNQYLHANNIRITYEKSWEKLLRKFSTLNHRKAMLIPIILTSVFIIFPYTKIDYLFAFFSVILLSLIFLYLKKSYKPRLEELPMIGMHDSDPKKNKYFLHLGDATRTIEQIRNPAIVHSQTPEVLEYPVLIDFDTALRHMFVVGTTGSGKTTFLIFLLKQHLALGGGTIIVDGKGDKDIYTDVFNACVHAYREDDFYVLNFNKPDESNTMNPLLVGSTDDIIDIVGNMLETGGDNGFWAGRALSMMKGLLSLLVPLRDRDELYSPGELSNIEKPGRKKYTKPIDLGESIHEPIFTFKVLNKFLDLENLRGLYFRIKDRNVKYPNDFIETDRMEAYLSSCGVPLGNANAQLQDGMTKMHGNSNTMWGEGLDLFMGTYGDIFNTDSPDIDMNDIVRNSRILYILLPATKKDPRTLSMLGKIILSFFKSSVAVLLGDKISGSIEERKATSAIRPKVPFWGVMDEYGAYATEGFDNVLAQARSLRVSIAIMVQETASLEKGSAIDKKRLLGNTGLKVFLKVEEQDTIDEIIKFFGEEEIASVRFSSEKATEKSFEVQRKPLITNEMLKNMSGGHAYVSFNGKITPMLAGYYKPPNTRRILEFSEFRNLSKQNYIIKKLVNAYKDDTDIFPKETNKMTTQEQIDNINESLDFGLKIFSIMKDIQENGITNLKIIDKETVETTMNHIIKDIEISKDKLK